MAALSEDGVPEAALLAHQIWLMHRDRKLIGVCCVRTMNTQGGEVAWSTWTCAKPGISPGMVILAVRLVMSPSIEWIDEALLTEPELPAAERAAAGDEAAVVIASFRRAIQPPSALPDLRSAV